jgi:hypothetical protein
VDLRLTKQTIPQAVADLASVRRNYSTVRDRRKLWEGVRFITGTHDAPVLSGVHPIP